MNLRLFVILALFFVAGQLHAQLIINEACNANGSNYTSQTAETPNWIELLNTSALSPIYLGDYYLSDDPADPRKFQLPEFELGPLSYLLIHTTARNIRPPKAGSWQMALGDFEACLYKEPTTVGPPANWADRSFVDAGWTAGNVGVGRGDGDDFSAVTTDKAVYVRQHFTISDTSQVFSAILHMDYDDAFVAYLNGVEIARANITGTPPAFNAYTLTPHEAQIYQGGIPERFAINDSVFNAVKQPGDNVLAIQVHANSPIDDDLSCRPFLSILVQSGVTMFSTSLPTWYSEISEVHANFKLSKTGEDLLLTHNTSGLINQVYVPDLNPDHSYGRVLDASPNWGIYKDATPGRTNNIAWPWSGQFMAPIISVQSGKYPGAFDVSIINPNDSGNIHYTFNRDNPDKNDPLYTGPMTITGTCMLKASIIESGSGNVLASPTNSAMYFIGFNSSLPIVSITADSNDLWGPTGMYSNPSAEYKRQLHVEYFTADGSLKFGTKAAGKIDGAASLSYPQKSIKILATNNTYGDEAPVNYKLIPDKPWLTQYHSFGLRDGGVIYDNLKFKDAFIQRLFKKTSLPYEAYTPCIAFINGNFWGEYEIRERINEGYLETNFNWNYDSCDVMSLGGGSGGWSPTVGTEIPYSEMRTFINGLDTTDPNFLKLAQTKLDIYNMADYVIAETWAANTDWLGNNVKAIHNQTVDDVWKFALHDIEYGFSNVNQNMFNFLESGWGTTGLEDFHQKFVNYSDFRIYFINRYADLMNTILLPEETVPTLNGIYNEFKPEFGRHCIRWYGDSTAKLTTMLNAKNVCENFCLNRNIPIRNQMLDYYDLTKHVEVTVNVNPPGAGRILLNSIVPDSLPFYGLYFDGNPITVTAIANPGYSFTDWDVSPYISSLTVNTFTANINSASGTTFVANFNSISDQPNVVVSEINYNSESSTDAGNWIEVVNNGTADAELTGYGFKNKQGHIYTFPNGTVLPVNDYLVIHNNSLKFDEQHPSVSNSIGPFPFDLGNDGDSIMLVNPIGLITESLGYHDVNPWPMGADGTGRTLEREVFTGFPTNPNNWFDGCIKGSPGTAYVPCGDELIFSEINYHSNPLYNSGDWVELRNVSTSPIDISGYRFAQTDRTKDYVIPASTILNPGENLVLYQSTDAFNSRHALVTKKLGPFVFEMGDEGDNIRMYDAQGYLLQSVVYDDLDEWPLDADGNLYTLEISDINGRMNEGSNWFAGCPEGSPAENYFTPCWPDGIEEMDLQDLVVLYPNPVSADDMVNVQLPASMKEATLTVSSSIGQIVLELNSAQSGFSTEGWQAGIYLVRIQSNEKTYNGRLLIK